MAGRSAFARTVPVDVHHSFRGFDDVPPVPTWAPNQRADRPPKLVAPTISDYEEPLPGWAILNRSHRDPSYGYRRFVGPPEVPMPVYDVHLRETARVVHTLPPNHAEFGQVPVQEMSTDGRMQRTVKQDADIRKSRSSDLMQKWVMLRLWVNHDTSYEIHENQNHDIRRLLLPINYTTTSVLVDPQSDAKGRRLQKRYGASSAGTDILNILPDNLYLVFGIPRAKPYMNASVSDFMDTLSTTADRSEKDGVFAKYGLSTKDNAELADGKTVPEALGRSRRDGDEQNNKSTANEQKAARKHRTTVDDRDKQRWYDDDLSRSQYRSADHTGQPGNSDADEPVKGPSPWDNDDLRKGRTLATEDIGKSWKFDRGDMDSNLRVYYRRDENDLRQGHEQTTDSGKYDHCFD